MVLGLTIDSTAVLPNVNGLPGLIKLGTLYVQDNGVLI
jgi:hypothetical protein